MADKLEQLTKQQAAAITTREISVALSAGAGCGKTFVLTRRFLSHLEPGPQAVELGKLVAITFTDRAAREMRSRIREECQRRLQSCPDEQVAHWQAIVRDLESARISTIHSFCTSLLRTHAVDAGLDPGFSVLERSAADAVLRHAVRDALLAQLEREDEDAKALVLAHGLERAIEVLQQLVKQRFRIDFDHWGEMDEAELVAIWNEIAAKIWGEKLAEVRQSDAAREVLEIMTHHAPADHKWIGPRRTALLEALPHDAPDDDPIAILLSIKSHSTLHYATRVDLWPSAEIHAQISDRVKELKALADNHVDFKPPSDEDRREAAACGLLALRVARGAVEIYEQRKREAGVLDFDDLLLKARNLLRDSPRVRRAAGAGISLLMVDEFQDTDPVQADIVQFLCGDRLVDGKLFLVGDHKQSIYRFRRADPRVFAALREKIPEQGQLPLNKNFRSQPAILNFVNAVFAGEMGEDYDELVPHVEQLSPEPAVEFIWAVPTGEEEAENSDVAQNRRREADWIARRLHQILHDGVPRIRDKNPQTGEIELRPALPGDVAILFRAMSDVQYYEQALQNYGLDYYLEGGRAFFAQQEVFDLINLCQYLSNPDDEISLVGVLRSPFFGLKDETLFALVHEAGSVSNALNLDPPAYLEEPQQEQARHAARVLAELHREKDCMPLHHVLNLALQRTGYDASLLAEFLGKRKLANLRKLIELARAHERTGLLTMADFVEQLRQAVAEETDEELAATHPESSNVIRLLTIHKSKGLEFPIVVVADMSRGANNRTASAEFDPELGPLVGVPSKFGRSIEHLGRKLHKIREETEDDEERKRVFYVAMTRAADHLILSAGLNSIEDRPSPWVNTLAHYFDLETGQPRIDEETGAAVIPADYLDRVPQVAVHTSEPQLPGFKKGATEKLLPLKRLRDELDKAESVQVPESLREYTADFSQRRQFSVSELEQIDAQLHYRPAAPTEPQRAADDDDILVDVDDATALGILVHAVLELADFDDFGDLAALVASSAAAMSRPPSEEIIARAIAMVGDFARSDVAAEIRGARRLFRELEFQWRCSPPGEHPLRYIAGFIDGLYEAADGAWTIIDYKTGHAGGAGTDEEKLSAYELQMGAYALAVRQLLGRTPDRVELVFLADNSRRLSLPVTDELLANVEKRLREAIAVVVDGTSLSAS